MMDNIPYDEWEQYLLQILYRFNVAPDASIAELGCGTGNMTRRLSANGFHMTGIDLSEDMLSIARIKQEVAANFREVRKGLKQLVPVGLHNAKDNTSKNEENETTDDDTAGLHNTETAAETTTEETTKLNSSGLHNTENSDISSDSDWINYILADIRDFTLPEKQDAMISVGDSMNYLLEVEDLSKAMKAARENLKDGGVFIFDLKTEYFFISAYDGRTFRGKADGIPYIWRNTYDREKHIHEYHLTFKEKQGGKKNCGDTRESCPGEKKQEEIVERHYQRTFAAKEIIEAARGAGFAHGAAYDAFTFDKPRKTSERIYIVLKN